MRVSFNPFAESFKANPYPSYVNLRKHGAFRALGMWVFTRYDDIKLVLKDRRFSSAVIPAVVDKRLSEFQMDCPEVRELGRKAIVFTDHQDHARLRRLANLVFNRDSLQALRPRVEVMMQQHLAAFLAGGGGDFMAQVARPLPLKLLLEWMAIDARHMEAVATWNHDIRYFLEPGAVNAAQFAQIYQSLKQFLAFFADIIAQRQAHPGDDMISRMLLRRVGDDGFSADEVAYMCVMAFVAGAETTQALLGNAAYLLAAHPAQYQQLLAGAVAPAQAAHEILRFESPLQMTKRLAFEDCTVAGVDIKAGEQILLCLGAGNHDERIFGAADVFDITRKNSDQHLGFGYGAHACVGAYLAQIELESFLQHLIDAHIALSLPTAPTWQSQSLIVRGFAQLSVTFTHPEDALANHCQFAA
jgi:cytochrome P450